MEVDGDTHDSLETETSLGESDEEDRALMELRTTMDTEHTYQYKESTREYRETNYLLQDTFIATHGFWLDYLVHDGSGPFLSEVNALWAMSSYCGITKARCSNLLKQAIHLLSKCLP